MTIDINKILRENDAREFFKDFSVEENPASPVEVTNFPDIPKSIIVSNLQEVKKYFDQLSTEIGKITLSPIIKAPDVKVDAPDLGGITESLQSLQDAISKLSNKNNTKDIKKLVDNFNKKFEDVISLNQQAFGAFPGPLALKSGSQVAIKSPKSIGDGTASITTGGTAQQITTTKTPCKRLVISPKDTNTSPIYIGGSTVTSLRGKQLYQGEDFDFEIDDVSKVYFISATTSDAITYMYTA